MHAFTPTVWLPRIFAFLLAALAAGSAAFWVLKWAAPSVGGDVTFRVSLEQDRPLSVLADASSVARALGAAGSISTPSAAPVLAASRFVLAGVVAGDSQQGATLISVDGKAAKPFVVGARVGDEWFVKSVQTRRAVLVRADTAGQMPRDGGAELVLDMPLPVRGANPIAALVPIAQ